MMARMYRYAWCSVLLFVTVAVAPATHADEVAEGVGWELYGQYCASCHGPDGGGYTGPAIIGPESRLESYANAQGLLDYISSAMPQDRPGSLSEADYRELLALLLVRNRFVEDGWRSKSADLNSIKLNK